MSLISCLPHIEKKQSHQFSNSQLLGEGKRICESKRLRYGQLYWIRQCEHIADQAHIIKSHFYIFSYIYIENEYIYIYSVFYEYNEEDKI